MHERSIDRLTEDTLPGFLSGAIKSHLVDLPQMIEHYYGRLKYGGEEKRQERKSMLLRFWDAMIDTIDRQEREVGLVLKKEVVDFLVENYPIPEGSSSPKGRFVYNDLFRKTAKIDGVRNTLDTKLLEHASPFSIDALRAFYSSSEGRLVAGLQHNDKVWYRDFGRARERVHAHYLLPPAPERPLGSSSPSVIARRNGWSGYFISAMENYPRKPRGQRTFVEGKKDEMIPLKDVRSIMHDMGLEDAVVDHLTTYPRLLGLFGLGDKSAWYRSAVMEFTSAYVQNDAFRQEVETFLAFARSASGRSPKPL